MGFPYKDERQVMEHRYAKVALLLSCLPLLCAMLGMPFLLNHPNSFGDDLVAISHPDTAMFQSAEDVLVPKAWLKSTKQHMASGLCKFEQRPDLTLPPQIKFIRVVGERNSGVDGVADMLSKLFPNITVGTGFTRGKFWFQNERILANLGNQDILDKVLVVVVLRNPYEWLRSFRRNPLHSPNHMYRHDWKTFLSKPWTTRTSSVDKEISKVPGVKCQAKYLAGEVLPCRQSRFNLVGLSLTSARQKKNMAPVYEMNPLNGLPFGNIIQLRKHKLLNYANMTAWVPRISFLKVENLASSDGIEKLRSVLRNNYNLATCSMMDDKPIELTEIHTKKMATTIQELDYINCNLDWTVEKLFGYAQKQFGEAISATAGESGAVCSADPFAARFSGKTFIPSDQTTSSGRSHSQKYSKSPHHTTSSSSSSSSSSSTKSTTSFDGEP